MTIITGASMLVAALASCAGACLLYVLKRPRAGSVLFVAGWGLNAAVFAMNWVSAGQPPFGNMYHVMVVLALCFLPLSAVLAVKEGLGWLRPYLALTAIFR
jgi:hypothetical protein